MASCRIRRYSYVYVRPAWQHVLGYIIIVITSEHTYNLFCLLRCSMQITQIKTRRNATMQNAMTVNRMTMPNEACVGCEVVGIAGSSVPVQSELTGSWSTCVDTCMQVCMAS